MPAPEHPVVGWPGPDGWLAELLRRCRFPDPSRGPVTLAVSGGADSAALTVLAGAAGLEGTVIHVDHGLRHGSEAESDAVAALAGRFAFGFESVRVHVPDGPDLEARARRARYAVLPAGVLTGHTMDDQAETVLLNLLWGAGLDGLSAMRQCGRSAGAGAASAAGEGAAAGAGAGWASAAGAAAEGGQGRTGVRRPMLSLRRAETVEICRRAGISPLQDLTNAETRFRRNAIRAELLPLMDRIAQRDTAPILARQAALMADDADLLNQLAGAIDPTDAAALRAAPPALARRAVRAWLRAGEELHPPAAAEVARVLDVATGRHRACEVSGGRRVSRRSGRLILGGPADRPGGVPG